VCAAASVAVYVAGCVAGCVAVCFTVSRGTICARCLRRFQIYQKSARYSNYDE